MDPDAYIEMANTEDNHWWFKARREILAGVIESLVLPTDAQILEVGSGTGGNLRMLSRYGHVRAMELDPAARNIAMRKTSGQFEIAAGSCPAAIPFADQRFDLVCMFDVLEHIDDDLGTLVALHGRMAPRGRMLVTVPAYMWLWSAHDVYLHHKRRYTSGRLRKVLLAGGFKINRVSYFNTALLPLAVAGRWGSRISPNRTHPAGTAVPPTTVNSALYWIFRSERHWLHHWNLPAGVSVLAVCQPSGG